MLTLLLHTAALAITVILVTRGQAQIDKFNLMALAFGLGIMSSLLFFFIGILSFVITFGITIFALQWACDITTKQSALVTTIWIAWQIAYEIAADVIFNE